MKLYPAPSGGETGKFEGVVSAFPGVWRGHVLDVGSRSGNLKRALGERITGYTSVDIIPPADIVGSIEEGLDRPDGAFDVVVALDVLEHTNDFHRAFRELCRLARHSVVISLPNAYDYLARARYIQGKPISGKYGIPLEPVLDRHRWLFSLTDASRFCHAYAPTIGWRVEEEGVHVGPGRARLGSLVTRFPDLLGQTYLVLLSPSR